MHFVFVMDPVSTVIVDEDTSFALMLEAQARGHRVDHCLASDVGLRGRRVVARVRRATMRLDRNEPITLGDPEDIDLVDVDAVFIRKDPPFTDAYLWLTLVLDHLEGSTLVVNDPRGLREANEKLYAHHFPEIVPATIMTSHKDEILRFVSDVGVNCGIMDQFASACGVENKLLLLDCRSLEWKTVPLLENVSIVIAAPIKHVPIDATTVHMPTAISQ